MGSVDGREVDTKLYSMGQTIHYLLTNKTYMLLVRQRLFHRARGPGVFLLVPLVFDPCPSPDDDTGRHQGRLREIDLRYRRDPHRWLRGDVAGQEGRQVENHNPGARVHYLPVRACSAFFFLPCRPPGSISSSRSL